MEPQERPIRNRFERHAITPGWSANLTLLDYVSAALHPSRIIGKHSLNCLLVPIIVNSERGG